MTFYHSWDRHIPNMLVTQHMFTRLWLKLGASVTLVQTTDLFLSEMCEDAVIFLLELVVYNVFSNPKNNCSANREV